MMVCVEMVSCGIVPASNVGERGGSEGLIEEAMVCDPALFRGCRRR